jgi:tRNA G18 (ribose-2'-O)-methylase SpoU
MPVVPVASADDPRIADYRGLADGELMRARGAFVAEGRFVVRRLAEGGRFAVRSLLVTDAALEALEDVVSARLSGVPVFLASKPVMREVTGFKFHQGCLALGERPLAAATVDEWLAELGRGPRTAVVLEAVSHADNVGAVFRNSAAFAADGVVLDPASADPLYRESIRVSMAATLQVPFARAERWPVELERLKAAGFQVVALTPRPSAPPISELATLTNMAERVAFLVGSEGPGLSAAALAHADVALRIPMAPGVDSLNLAAATAIALHERFRS